MLDIESVKSFLDIILSTASVLILIVKFLDIYFDYKFNQKLQQMELNMTKKNRCSSHKGKQR